MHRGPLNIAAAQLHVAGYHEPRHASLPQHILVATAPHLPPIHAHDMQAHFTAVPMDGGPIQQHPPLPTYQASQFSYPNGAVQMAPMPSGVGMPAQNGTLRYPIPPPPITPSQLAGGRHKKDPK